ncbi:MAG: TetR family transcriptional regulator [Ancylobacter novellus]|uniref:TetR family transcriptional regulator n=1 Tax=Ancylobacter novellus TaxID=921 RepID=A0A2W5LX75_ANCNO|nr:MAG: TetR family transcriptional regulator [Ancylobacter novellus]
MTEALERPARLKAGLTADDVPVAGEPSPSGSPRASRASRAEDQRRRILDAAIVCFARGGFHATGMQAVCAEAGMSPGALYRYFPSKEALIEAIVERDRADIPAELAPLLEAEDVVEALIDCARAFLVGHLRPESLPIFLELSAEALRNPSVRDIVMRCDAEVGDIVARSIGRGMAMGQIDPSLDPREATRFLMALTDGVLTRLLLEPAAELEGLMPMYERTVRRFLAPQAAVAAKEAAQ